MSVVKQIDEDLKTALKAGSSLEVATLRSLKNALHNAEILAGKNLDGQAEIAAISREAKQRQESIKSYVAAGRADMAKQEASELKVIERYLPKVLSEEKIAELINEAIAQTKANSLADTGKVMSYLSPKLAGRADMGKVSQLVKQRLDKG